MAGLIGQAKLCTVPHSQQAQTVLTLQMRGAIGQTCENVFHSLIGLLAISKQSHSPRTTTLPVNVILSSFWSGHHHSGCKSCNFNFGGRSWKVFSDYCNSTNEDYRCIIKNVLITQVLILLPKNNIYWICFSIFFFSFKSSHL